MNPTSSLIRERAAVGQSMVKLMLSANKLGYHDLVQIYRVHAQRIAAEIQILEQHGRKHT